MEGYSQRKLTFGEDKLIALSGLAHNYYEREHQSEASHRDFTIKGRGKYGAGLWEADMPSALMWQTRHYPPDMTQAINASPRQPPQRPSGYRAPSWSWASVDGEISYDSQKPRRKNPDYRGIWNRDGPPTPRETSEYEFGAFRVNEIDTTTSPSDPMGAVSAGHIILTGLVATAAIMAEETHTRSRSGWRSTSTYTLLQDPDSNVVGAVLADVQTELQPFENIYCISVRDEQDGAEVGMPEDLGKVNNALICDCFEKREMVMGLGLAKIAGAEGDEEVFRRLGLVRWVRKELFAGEEVSTIRII